MADAQLVQVSQEAVPVLNLDREVVGRHPVHRLVMYFIPKTFEYQSMVRSESVVGKLT